MTAATLSRPDAPARRMTAKQAFDLRTQMREAGWTPIESATDFRQTTPDLDRVGDLRTVAYFPEFKNLLGGAMGWSRPGQVDAPEQASFVETYEVTADPLAGRWAPVV